MKKYLLSIFALTFLLGFNSFESLGQCMTGFNITALKHVSCFGGNDAEITVTVSGGRAPFTYELYIVDGGGEIPVGYIGGSTNTTVTFGVSQGNVPDTETGIPAYPEYRLRVTSSETTLTGFGCRIRNISGVSITQPTLLNPQVAQILPACNGNDGSIILNDESTFGGTAPYTYTWSNSLPAQKDQMGNLVPGTYSVTVTDNLGCATPINNLVVLPPPNATITAVNPVCSYEQAFNLSAVTSGGTWSGTGITDASAGTFDPTTAGAGSHEITYIVSLNGCTHSDTETIVVLQAPDPTIAAAGPFCIIDDAVTLTAATAGGTWSGTGITDPSAGTFDPATAGAGSHNITYSVTVDGCTSTDSETIVVYPMPDATIAPAGPLCSDGAAVTLTAATAGGTWSGTGITDPSAGTFNPTTAGTGSHIITYTISVNGCESSDTETIVVNPAPNATITPAGPVCVDAAAFNLSAATAGGTWSGAGITNASAGTFNPSTAGAGSHEITYSVTVNGCTSTDTETIVVHPMPDATITPAGPVCVDASAFNFSAATTGGTWSGTGITNTSAGTFDPATAGVGSHLIRYEVTVNGCTSSDTETIVVQPMPNATITAAGPVCSNDAAFNLSAAIAGGTWSGTGITDASAGTFNPATAGAGSHDITYQVTVNGCTSTDTETIIVNPAPDATITPAGPVCIDAPAFNLTAATAGGTWSGQGITNASAGTFNPTTAGAGSHQITYTVTVNGCTSIGRETIVVHPLPNATITPAGPFCSDGAAVNLAAATAGGTWSGTGITDASAGTFNPATAGTGSHEITYSVTVNGCTSSDTETIIVNPAPNSTIAPAGPLCSNGTAVTLSAATTGGTWSGTGITDASAGTFNPATAGAGSHEITYSVTVNGCTTSDTETIVVNPAPDATITAAGPVCVDATAFNLTAATAGGSWSGTGITDVTAGTFDPATAGVGSHLVTYTVTENGCTSSDTETILVNPMPDATISAVTPVCSNDDAFALTAATEGGTWSGTGITDASTGMFDPATAGAGSHEITYSVTVAGCTSTDTETIIVNPAPDATIAAAGPFCITDDEVTLSAATTGGSWSGPGITDVNSGTFNPGTAGIGTHRISYTLTINGCTSVGTQNLVVNPAPDATITAAGPFCSDGEAVNLAAATAGGTWSGAGITNASAGTFNPATAGVGSHLITYSVTVGGCTSSDTETIVVNPAPDATIAPAGPFCTNDVAITLSAATAGGTWSGTGITDASAGTFNPATAGAGSHFIRYEVTVNGCTSFDTETIVVNPAPNANINPAGPVCINAAAFNLTAATVGGAWSGTGITNSIAGTFDPATAGVGSHEITYSVTVNGCTSVDIEIIVVNPLPDATIAAVAPVCSNDAPFNLTAATTGGTWSGTGITDGAAGTFNPATAGAGTHAITYSVTVNGCTSSDTETVVVNPAPNATIAPAGPVCADAPAFNLSAATTGGTWSGTGITDASAGTFNPATAGVGSHLITYSITVNGCTSTDTETIVVRPIPVATPSNLGPYCEGNNIQLRAAAVTGATYLWTYPNGTTSTERNHNILNATVANAGTYRLTITVNGCTSAEATTEVVVNPRPVAPAPINNGPICAGETLMLRTEAVPGATYSWIGPSGFTSSEQNPEILNATTAHAGDYSLRITTNNCTSATGTTTVIINSSPTQPEAVSPNQICVNTPVEPLTAAGTDLRWYRNADLLTTDGFGETFDPAPFIDNTVAGDHNFYVTQTVNGCISPARTVTVSIIDGQPAPPVAEDVIVCINQTPTLTAIGTEINWYIDDSRSIWIASGNTFEAPSSSRTGSTTYYATQTVCEIESEVREVRVTFIDTQITEQPTATLTGVPACTSFEVEWTAVAGITGYRWDLSTDNSFGTLVQNNVAASGTSISITGLTPGTNYFFRVRGENQCGPGPNSATLPVTLPSGSEVPGTTALQPLCLFEPIPELFASGTNIRWYNQNGDLLASGNFYQPTTAEVDNTVAGTTSFLVTQTSGSCLESQTVTVSVTYSDSPQAPVVSGEPAASLCLNMAVPELSATGTDVVWYRDAALGDIAGVGSTFTPDINNTIEGSYTYYVTQTDACGNESEPSQVTIIYENNPPAAPGDVQSPAPICINEPVPALTATGTNLKWYENIGDATPIFEGNNFVADIDNTVTGSYTYYVSQTTECGEGDRSSVTITYMNDPSCNTNTVNCPDSDLAITLVGEIQHTDCNSQNSGSATVSASGGLEHYTFAWFSGEIQIQTGPDLTGVAAGDYVARVTDVNGCFRDLQVIIYESFSITPTIVHQTNCTTPNGSIIVAVAGGSGNYAYQWSTPLGSDTEATGLSAGTYQLEVTDMESFCSRTVSYTIINNCNGGGGGGGGGPVNCDAFRFNFIFNQPDCGRDNGTVTFDNLRYNGAVPASVMYSIKKVEHLNYTNQPNDGVFITRGAGNYQYIVEANGESCTGTFTLDPRTTVTASASNFGDVTCFGQPTGRARIDASGSSTGRYYYSSDEGTTWTQFTPGNTVTNLPPNGTYNIRVGESENDPCPSFVSVTINNINTQIAFEYTATEASCNGNDGSLTVTSISGGVPGYEISFMGGAYEPFNGSRLYRDIDRGFKTISIRDASGCVFTSQALVPSPNQVVANVFKLADPSCSGDGMDGSIRIVVDRNNTLVAPPYRYGISEDLDDATVMMYPLIRDGNDDYVAVVDNLARGTTYYVYVVSSDNSCPTQIPVSFDNGPIAVDFDIINVGNIACKGDYGSLTFGNVSRDSEMQFTVDIFRSGVIEPVFTKNMLNISTLAGYTIGEAEYEFTAGNYHIRISQNQSQCGTPMRSALKEFTITEPLASLSGRVKNTEISLPDQPTGSIFIDQIRGGVWPYYSKIKLVAPAFQSQEIDRDFTEVNRNPNNLEYEVLYSNLYAGTYEVTIQDDNGCEMVFKVVLDFDQSLFIPNVFSPNGDGTNDTFFVRNLPETGTNLVVTNRWGKTVYKVVDYQNNWTGGDLPDGVYFYTLISTGKKYNGWVEIWRGPKY